LHCVKEITVEEGELLAGEDLVLEDDLTNAKPIAQKMGERASRERRPSNRSPGLESSQLGDDPLLAQVYHQAVEAPKLKI
jgi:hypothetical protein